jgi:hypothetical protein
VANAVENDLRRSVNRRSSVSDQLNQQQPVEDDFPDLPDLDQDQLLEMVNRLMN